MPSLRGYSYLPIIKTRRLFLRKLSLKDTNDLFEYARNPKVSKYTLWSNHKSKKETKYFLKYILSNYAKKVPENWGIVYKKDNKLIGTCGYFDWDKINRSAEIHYALSEKYWNKGIMSEALESIISFGFKKMKLNKIRAKCMLKNTASEKLMQKLGMKYMHIIRRGIYAKNRFHDLKVYSIKKDYKKIENRK